MPAVLEQRVKVESIMKILDEIHAYQGELYLEEIPKFISNINERLNYSVHTSTGKIPIIALEKKKFLTTTTECECKKLI